MSAYSVTSLVGAGVLVCIAWHLARRLRHWQARAAWWMAVADDRQRDLARARAVIVQQTGLLRRRRNQVRNLRRKVRR